ncbi:hypothetical protein PR202_gb21896 [Eleusine coracana subsp. coracana]|uniref:TRAF-type domain-containing protein n=1 Tax=Eleusine coracana subsp. coracana TaxID=191504 RepID=A0AAV5FFX6_ELECO|nr:hypothetical protein PR202_gb21896 [Eleusine coracana subsp. coracana]
MVQVGACFAGPRRTLHCYGSSGTHARIPATAVLALRTESLADSAGRDVPCLLYQSQPVSVGWNRSAEIPSSNIALHSVHCARNLQKCEHCGDMVPRKLMDEHYGENHAPVNCSLCKSSIERELWDLHSGIQCPQRMLACQYCEFELPAVDLFEHQVCIYLILRTYVEVVQNFVNNAGSTSDSVNGLDMKFSSIQIQVLMQNIQVMEAHWNGKSVLQHQGNQYATLLMVQNTNFS